MLFTPSHSIPNPQYPPDPTPHMDRPSPKPTTRPHHGSTGSGGGGGREDCWSEGATEMLIEAWGDRYVELNRGNLRQKDWKEVADAVNGRHNGVKPRKTDIQCKNRIDTLKKKYKLEKAKSPSSQWPFFYRLDSLIGTNATAKKPTTVTFTVKPSSKPKPNPNPNPNPVVYSGVGSTDSSVGDDDDDNDVVEDDDDDDGGGVGFDARVSRKHRTESVDLSDGAACRELARAILKFGEIYERIESSKQQQMIELERQRMEFTKDLEFQRMNMFMDAQLEIKKMKRSKYAPSSGKKQ